jgi:hypothetical protein
MNKSRIVGAVVCSALLALAASGHEPMTPDETINSFEDTFDVHPQTLLKNRTRICATGEFMGTPQASALSRSMIAAAKADPNAGMPDVQKLHEFLAAHPGAFAQSNFVTATDAPSSYASSAYFSVSVTYLWVCFLRGPCKSASARARGARCFPVVTS